MARGLLLAAALAACASSLPRAARAADPATAQALYDQGRKLMSQHRYADACPKLEESQKLDPAGGTLLALAICREHEGRLATAWAHYQDALTAAKRDGNRERAKMAEGRIAVLGPRLPRMRVHVAAGDRAMKGFAVTRDDAPVGPAQWGEAIPVDPGARTLRAEAEGHAPWVARVDVPPEPREIVVDVPELAPLPSATPAGAASAAGGATSATRAEATPARGDAGSERDAARGDTQRTAGLVATGAGAVGLGAAVVFGLLSMGAKSDAKGHCAPPDYKLCDASGVDAGDRAITYGNVSTVTFVVGGALVAGGLALYFTAPSGSARASLGVSPGGVVVAGSFP